MVPSVDRSGDPRSVPPYVPTVNPSIALGEQQVRALQEEIRTTLEEVKALENIIASEEINVDEADQLRELVVFECWRLM